MRKLVTALVLLPFLQSASLAQSAVPDPAAGKTLWEGPNTQCKNCHGRNGEGAFGPDLAGRGLSAAEFQQAVRKPWGVMPTFTEDQVSDAELANIAAYFASLPKVDAPGAWRVTAAADASHGQQVFISAGCAQCHGATFDQARGALGGHNADFALFKELVYTHTTAMPKFEPQRPGSRLHMGNFNALRLSEAQLKEIYDWAHDDLGFRPDLQARFTAGASGATGATYALNVTNNGETGKGLAATGLTIDLAIPAGVTVTGATGDGYKGVHMDATTKANVAEWQMPRMTAQDTRAFTITLSQPPANVTDLKGTIRWSKPAPKTGPNLDVVNFGMRPAGFGGPGGG